MKRIILAGVVSVSLVWLSMAYSGAHPNLQYADDRNQMDTTHKKPKKDTGWPKRDTTPWPKRDTSKPPATTALLHNSKQPAQVQ